MGEMIQFPVWTGLLMLMSVCVLFTVAVVLYAENQAANERVERLREIIRAEKARYERDLARAKAVRRG